MNVCWEIHGMILQRDLCGHGRIFSCNSGKQAVAWDKDRVLWWNFVPEVMKSLMLLQHKVLWSSNNHPPEVCSQFVWSNSVIFNLFCSLTPRYIFSSSLYPQSYWFIIQVIHNL
jgi:hypothetical protein